MNRATNRAKLARFRDSSVSKTGSRQYLSVFGPIPTSKLKASHS